MEKITRRAMALARSYGACAVGVATFETLEAVAPAEGQKRIAEMDPNTRALYENI